MQTFLPYPDFRASAACLDNKRLGKQRVECLQIFHALTGYKCVLESAERGYEVRFTPQGPNPRAWSKHPAVRMWESDIPALVAYTLDVCKEWKSRGFVDSCADKIIRSWRAYAASKGLPQAVFATAPFPSWITMELCLSHRSNLIRKNWLFYASLWPGVPNDLPYVWPTPLAHQFQPR